MVGCHWLRSCGACALSFSLSGPLNMALELARLINCDVADSDREKIDNLLEEYMCGNDDEPDSDSDVCNASSSDEDDHFDDRRNDFDDAMEVAAKSEDIVFDAVDEELAKVTSFRYVHLQLLCALSKFIYNVKLLHECRLTVCGSFYLHDQWHMPLS